MNDTHPDESRLIEHVLEELAPAERAQVDSHVATCRSCRAQVDVLVRVIDTVRSATSSPPPPSVLIDLLERQAASSARRSRPRWRLAPLPAAAVAAALAVVFLTGFWLGGRSEHATGSSGPRPREVRTIQRPLPEPPRLPFQVARAIGDT